MAITEDRLSAVGDNEATVETTTTMRVKKRNGALEPVDLNKIVNAVARASEGLIGVDPMVVSTRTISALADGATPPPRARLVDCDHGDIGMRVNGHDSANRDGQTAGFEPLRARGVGVKVDRLGEGDDERVVESDATRRVSRWPQQRAEGRWLQVQRWRLHRRW